MHLKVYSPLVTVPGVDDSGVCLFFFFRSGAWVQHHLFCKCLFLLACLICLSRLSLG